MSARHLYVGSPRRSLTVCRVTTSVKTRSSDVPTHIEDKSFRLAGGHTGFLLIHGLGGTPVEMRYIAQGLARAGHTVHVPQLAGHCGNVDDLTNTGWIDWYDTVEEEHRLLREKCDKVIAGGLSMGAILALHHAAQHPQDVSALALYAPSLWLDGWGVPWYTRFFSLITQKWLADYIPFAERHPWGIKDPRIRALVEQAITSGDSSQAGIAAIAGWLASHLIKGGGYWPLARFTKSAPRSPP